MSDLRSLRPSEYSILKAALPLSMDLDARYRGDYFKEFWKLPPCIRQLIAGYDSTFERFELYKADGGNHFFIFALKEELGNFERVNVIGEFKDGAMIETQWPVTDAMLKQVQEIAAEPLTWPQLLHMYQAPYQVFLGFALIGLLSLIAFTAFGSSLLAYGNSLSPPLHGIAAVTYIGVTAWCVVAGLLLFPMNVFQNWRSYKARREYLNHQLQTYWTFKVV